MTMEIPKEARKEAIASIERCWAISPGRRRQNLAAPTAWAKKTRRRRRVKKLSLEETPSP